MRRWPGLGWGLIVLGAGMAVNSLLGPWMLDLIRYPFSETLTNQTIGLEAFSLVVIAPWSIAAGVLALRGHRAAPVLALAPGLYVAYMFLQYIVGPEYLHYPGVLPLQLGLFVLSGVLTFAAWQAIGPGDLPPRSRPTERRLAIALFALAAFVVSRYVPALFAALEGQALAPEFADSPSMYWSIFLLDLGVVVPATIAAGLALVRGLAWGPKAMYAVVGWFALVPPSVAAMALAMLARDDPAAAAGDVVLFVAVSVIFAAFAAWLYRPLFGTPPWPGSPVPVRSEARRHRRTVPATGR